MTDRDLLAEVFVAEQQDGITDIGKTEPAFPGENPSKRELIDWVETWEDILNTSGYSALLRGKDTFDLKKLAPRELIPYPVGADDARKAAIDLQNSSIKHSNDVNAAEKHERLLELNNRVASKLSKAMRKTAPIKLKKLRAEHKAKELDGTPTADSYMGADMFNKLRSEVKSDVREYDQKRYNGAYEKMRDTKSPDNISSDAFSKRINMFTVQINPFIRHPLEGEDLGKFIIDQLPSTVGPDARILKRALAASSDVGKTLADADHVLAECVKLIEDAFDPKKAPAKAYCASWFAGVAAAGDADGQAAGGKAAAGGNPGVSAREVKKVVAAAVKEQLAAAKPGSDAAAVTTPRVKGDAKADDKTRLRSGNRLPAGQRCSKDTCTFAHDRLRPGEPCYRDPRWAGPLPLNKPRVDMPATDAMLKAYDRAHARESKPSAEQLKRYGGKVGAMVYTSPCVRVDTCWAISRLARALTFPTPEMEAAADRVMLYLAQTADACVTFDGEAPDAGVLMGESDSDWAVGHSTTGWIVFLAGAAVAYRSFRQACIAMSSTEAEIIAASSCAVELVHFRTLLTEMGLPQAPTRLYVDNSGAVELARDRKSCHRSRHVDRRYFKVRELVHSGQILVEHIDTKENSADLLTKPLKIDAYIKHRVRALNARATE
jgi:hypothetical protein